MTTDITVIMMTHCSWQGDIRCQMTSGSLVKSNIRVFSCLIGALARHGSLWLTPGYSSTRVSKTSMKLKEILSGGKYIEFRRSWVLLPKVCFPTCLLAQHDWVFPTPEVLPQFFSISKTNKRRKKLLIGMLFSLFHEQTQTSEVWTIIRSKKDKHFDLRLHKI